MIVLNFSHPLTAEQHRQIEALTGGVISEEHNLDVSFDHQAPFDPQLDALMSSIPLSAEALQTESILINPPSLNVIALMVFAALHGRMGYFPPAVRLRPVEGALPPRFDVAEILNLMALRDRSRLNRFGR